MLARQVSLHLVQFHEELQVLQLRMHWQHLSACKEITQMWAGVEHILACAQECICTLPVRGLWWKGGTTLILPVGVPWLLGSSQLINHGCLDESPRRRSANAWDISQ